VFGVVLELFVVEKQLFTRSKDELTVTVRANQQSIDELSIHIASPVTEKDDHAGTVLQHHRAVKLF
jgi:hypothetical protein